MSRNVTTEVDGFITCPGPSETVGYGRGATPRSIDPRLCPNHEPQKVKLARDEISWTHADLGGDGNTIQTSNIYYRLADGSDPTCGQCGSMRQLSEDPPPYYKPRNAMYGPYSLVDQRSQPEAGHNMELGRIQKLEQQIAAMQDRDTAVDLQAQITALKGDLEKPKPKAKV